MTMIIPGSSGNLQEERYSALVLIDRFEEIASQHKQKIAISDTHGAYTYQELKTRADNRCRELVSKGVRAGDGVAITLSHSFELIVSILAVMKAGAYYIPVDPKNPSERKGYILNDSNPKAEIHQYQGSIKITKNIETAGRQVPDQGEPLAYVIYTSGTTGSPKGVGVTQASIKHLLKATQKLFNFDENDVWMLCHSYAFDFSVWEIWGALWHGAKIIIPNEISILDSSELVREININKVSVLNQTPVSFKSLQKKLGDYDLNGLKYIIFGGEKLIAKNYSHVFRKLQSKGIKIINMYGITEATVHATFHEISERDIQQGRSVIGTLLPGFEYVILGEHGEVSNKGELYLAGPQVSQGYIFDKEKTKQRFVRIGKFGEVFYKTGDLVREVEGGELEYFGRNDDQVKIRGYRIELGEVEITLDSMPGVASTIVLRVESEISGGDLLCFYIVSDGCSLSKREIKIGARKLLPSYMVPTYFNEIKEIPRTSNGKIDKACLIKQWRKQ